MQDLHKLGELYTEGVANNTFNNASHRAFMGAVDTIHKKLPKGGRRNPKSGRFRKEPFFAKVYNAIENGLEKLVGTGQSILGHGLTEDISNLKAKIYYIILRQQPPVGVAFKRELQQKIYDARTVGDLDQLANQYKAGNPWVSYKRYLQEHSR